MRLFALILAWLAWALLLNATLTGPVLFFSSAPPKPDEDATLGLILPACYSGAFGIVLLIFSRVFFDGKLAGALRSWLSVFAFLFCRLMGLSLLAGAIILACLASHRENTLNGWIGVAVGLAALIYTARHPRRQTVPSLLEAPVNNLQPLPTTVNSPLS